MRAILTKIPNWMVAVILFAMSWSLVRFWLFRFLPMDVTHFLISFFGTMFLLFLSYGLGLRQAGEAVENNHMHYTSICFTNGLVYALNIYLPRAVVMGLFIVLNLIMISPPKKYESAQKWILYIFAISIISLFLMWILMQMGLFTASIWSLYGVSSAFWIMGLIVFVGSARQWFF